MYGKLYLIPTPISDDEAPMSYMPQYNEEVLCSIKYFVVEQVRTARRFISKAKIGIVIDSLNFVELNEHTSSMDIENMLAPIFEGHDVGVMSEAGVPGVADPGAEVVAIAHRKGVEVIPLIGPSSILLSLMASGMNGQSFCFNGYLPVKAEEKISKLRELERRAISNNQTQLFIETPYRNDSLFDDMLKILSDKIFLCVACNITSHNQYIKTLTIKEWKNTAKPSLKKIPAIFLIGSR